jgi:hypothetical protein
MSFFESIPQPPPASRPRPPVWSRPDAVTGSSSPSGAAIRAAARRAVVLWPDQPDLESGRAWQSSTIIAEAHDEGSP